jgi:hypothetical protein
LGSIDRAGFSPSPDINNTTSKENLILVFGFINTIAVVTCVKRQYLYLLGPTEWVPPEEGDRIQSS